jgi:release factor glutamine methyltransferase
LPTARVYGTDISAAALSVAARNGADLPNLRLAQSDLLAALVGPFDLVCANLPYIASAELDILEVARFEPLVALDGGADGLALVRRLLAQVPGKLARPGLLLLEIGADQGVAAAEAARTALPGAAVRVLKDYAGLDRVVEVAR